MPFAQIITKLISVIQKKVFRPEIPYFPYIMMLNYSKLDKEWMVNVKTLRNYADKLIAKRREELHSNPEAKNTNSDLLTILLQNHLYSNDNEMLVSECMTFFIGGSQTVRSSNANQICFINLYPEVKEKVLSELYDCILKDFKKPYDI